MILESDTQDRRLWALEAGALWRGLAREPAAFWLLCFYVSVEYLRPQAVYPALGILPWGEVSIAACFLALMFLGGGRPRRLVPMDALVALFFLWVLLSAIFALSPQEAFRAWAGVVSWAVLYFLLTRIVITPRRLFLFFLVFFLVNLKMSQHGTRVWIGRGLSFAPWGATGSPGWFQNSGEFSMEMAAFLGISWCVVTALKPYMGRVKLWLVYATLSGTATMSILASSSRGGQIAGALVVFSLMLVSRLRPGRILMLGIVLAVGWHLVPGEQKARFEEMGEDNTSQSRLTYWDEGLRVAAQNPLFGIGYENWVAYSEKKHGVGAQEVHNSLVEASVELGFPAAILFLGMVAITYRMNARTRRRSRPLGEWGRVLAWMATGLDVGMVGLFVAGQFMSVLFYPMYWMSFGLTVALSESVSRVEERYAAAAGRRVQGRSRGGAAAVPASVQRAG